MAIDSKKKRVAVLGVARPFMRDKFPVATPDEEWRISSGNAYGGNALSPVTGGRIMGSLSGKGGLAGHGGIAGPSGGIAG
ncbi:MAG: hypothetical protein BMS9Abin11_1834 [Gammaproteobacteria bacterium]|nr:MAG: hypothetical protein BMS9Abin11_1834 [Gammaproteobacteria bacterium]